QGDRVRPDLHAPDDRARVHRQPPVGGAPVPARPRPGRGPRQQLPPRPGRGAGLGRRPRRPPRQARRGMSLEFDMRRPQGFVTAPADGLRPLESADEEEADPVALQSAAEADLGAVLDETNVVEVLDQLDRELIALNPVKTRIREIAALLLIDKLRRDVGLASERPSLHMSFTGNPGTGKTTVAMKMAQVLHRLGYIEEPRVVACTRDDLVGQYVGHTAPKTKEVLRRAYGGVLFIDEAYYLYRPENERDYGQEAIEILLQVMEAERDKLVVIFAGYKDRMDEFFRSNPGLSSRVAH